MTMLSLSLTGTWGTPPLVLSFSTVYTLLQHLLTASKVRSSAILFSRALPHILLFSPLRRRRRHVLGHLYNRSGRFGRVAQLVEERVE